MRFGKTAEITATLTAASTYTALDVVGGLAVFDLAGLDAGGGVTLRQLRVTDAGNIKGAGSVYFYNAVPVTVADNAAFVRPIADMNKEVYVATLPDYVSNAGNTAAIAHVRDINVSFPVAGGKFWMYFVCSATPNYSTSTTLKFTAFVWLD